MQALGSEIGDEGGAEDHEDLPGGVIMCQVTVQLATVCGAQLPHTLCLLVFLALASYTTCIGLAFDQSWTSGRLSRLGTEFSPHRLGLCLHVATSQLKSSIAC